MLEVIGRFGASLDALGSRAFMLGLSPYSHCVGPLCDLLRLWLIPFQCVLGFNNPHVC